ncbi:N-acetyltransferase [Rhizobium sp. CFBP 8762]|uniref:GNAT family N-acetyltransferase n=1 Tax=Rhizobium sp. CFBP 8762 TaxID=2775279 RepID=UPI0017802F4C|nr:GNAT family N-acetyltransferase [Rhizobium sp. CFBP 8762]MBD8553790.1 N-acetyltransferase [Rhizobium sp. CFBP 8762]
MTFSIRNATSLDLDAITAIYAESVLNGVATYEIDPPSVAEMTGRFESITNLGYPYLVAIDDDGVVLGYAYASAFRTRSAYRFMVEDSIYLAPQSRGQGVGKALLQELVFRCASLGFRQMVAVIGGAHPASIGVHRSAGFEDGGVMKASGLKHGRWLDTTIMQLALGEGAQSLPQEGVYPETLYKS